MELQRDDISPAAQPTPPKSSDAIREKLAAIHAQAPSVAPSGPLAGGLPPEDRLIIASFHDREVRRRFQELLVSHGIGSAWRRRQGRDEVLVDAGDRAAAARLREEHARADPDRIEARGRRVIDFALLGAVLGATISTAFVAERTFARNQARWALIVISALAFSTYGAIVGGLLGALKERYSQRGRLQFTILDLLLLSALVALASLVWRLWGA